LREAITDLIAGQDTTLKSPKLLDEVVSEGTALKRGGSSRW